MTEKFSYTMADLGRSNISRLVMDKLGIYWEDEVKSVPPGSSDSKFVLPEAKDYVFTLPFKLFDDTLRTLSSNLSLIDKKEGRPANEEYVSFAINSADLSNVARAYAQQWSRETELNGGVTPSASPRAAALLLRGLMHYTTRRSSDAQERQLQQQIGDFIISQGKAAGLDEAQTEKIDREITDAIETHSIESLLTGGYTLKKTAELKAKNAGTFFSRA